MKHVARLRLSLLVSLGLVPVACGGSAVGRGDGGDTGGDASGGTGVAGSPNTSGGPSKAGSSNVGGATTTGGMTGLAGTTGNAGAPIAGAGGAIVQPFRSCTAPKVDPESGLVTCGEGYRHRPKAVECEVTTAGAPGFDGAAGAGAEEPDPGPLPRATGATLCSTTSECQKFDLGYCEAGQGGGICRSGCRIDADCGPNFVCICSGPSLTGGVCLPAGCHTDADCGPGSRCASFEGVCGGGGFTCQQTGDECSTSADCVGGATCSWDQFEDRRYCLSAACGRPFLVEAEARVACVVSSNEWNALEGAAPSVDHLTAAERALLAEHWSRMGQMEHASIAAFARFNLQLLALGAPPSLVEACTRALSDETAHARLCFQLASAYAGRAVGPGPLDVSGNLLPTALGEIVELVIAEGCFGETSAALEALEAAESASDPVIAAAYQRIARDEQRHAELAFQFVRWALLRDREVVAACVGRATVSPPSRDRGALDVALPCLRALLFDRVEFDDATGPEPTQLALG